MDPTVFDELALPCPGRPVAMLALRTDRRLGREPEGSGERCGTMEWSRRSLDRSSCKQGSMNIRQFASTFMYCWYLIKEEGISACLGTANGLKQSIQHREQHRSGNLSLLTESQQKVQACSLRLHWMQ